MKNAYLLAKIGADTAENEQDSAEILPIGRRGRPAGGAAGARRGVDLPHASGVRLLLLSHPQDIDVELTVLGFFRTALSKRRGEKKGKNVEL